MKQLLFEDPENMDPITVALRELLISAYVRVQARAEGRSVPSMSPDDRLGIVEHYSAHMEPEVQILDHLVKRARVEGAEFLRDKLISDTEIDPVMVDQAAFYARKQPQVPEDG